MSPRSVKENLSDNPCFAAPPRAEVSFSVQERQFDALFNGVLDAVLIADNERRYVNANPAACDLLKMTRHEIVGRRIDDFSSPDVRGLAENSWQALLEQGEQQGEWRILLPDGTTRDVEFRARAHFVPGFHLSILRDVTEHRRTEAGLRASEAQFRSLVEAIPQQVWTAQPGGALDYVSQRVLEYSGHTFQEMVGEGWLQILHPGDVAECLARWNRALATGEPYEIEFRLRRAGDGAYRWHLGRALPLRDAEGNVIKWFGTNTDITERKLIEEERGRLLAQEQAARAAAEAANRAKDQFLVTLSHELKTPLSAILGWANLLHGGGLSEADARHALEVIERSARTQARLIEDILDASRAITGKMSLDVGPLDLGPVIEAVADAMHPAVEAKDIRLRVFLDPNAQPISGDPHRLQQVVWNLLSNAVKFTPRGGQIEVKLMKMDANMEISVRDDGEGIKSEFLPYVFERFYQAENARTRDRKGMGLGLAIVRHLVELHGGTVRAESAGPGLGATFILTLPVPPTRATTEAGPSLATDGSVLDTG
jgi:PAS domain S-box-containing protein